LALAVVALGLVHSGTSAAAPQSGVQITPLRDFQTAKPGGQKRGDLTVTNLSSKPETITMSVKTFSVTDYTYDYKFSAPKSDWIHFSQNSAMLGPGESQPISYYITPDAKATPGGYYFTLIASTTIGNPGATSTVQAATLLYLTVDGKLIKTGDLENAHVQRLVFGPTINYSADAKNSGNVHYFISTSSRLYGIFAGGDTAPTSHLLLPGTIRRIDGSEHSPVLPGLYRVAITYQTDSGLNYTTSRYLLYLPLWSFALALGVVLVVRGFRRPKKARPTATAKKPDKEKD
jgi:hypothetical protein